MKRTGRVVLAMLVVGLTTVLSTGSALAGSYTQPRQCQ